MSTVFRSFSLRKALSTLAMLVVSLSLACGTAATATPSPVHPSPALGDSEGGISPILATTVLRTGTQRVSFLLTGPTVLADHDILAFGGFGEVFPVHSDPHFVRLP